jgi:hypothetical protein
VVGSAALCPKLPRFECRTCAWLAEYWVRVVGKFLKCLPEYVYLQAGDQCAQASAETDNLLEGIHVDVYGLPVIVHELRRQLIRSWRLRVEFGTHRICKKIAYCKSRMVSQLVAGIHTLQDRLPAATIPSLVESLLETICP